MSSTNLYNLKLSRLTAWNRMMGITGIRVFDTRNFNYAKWLYFRKIQGIGSSEMPIVCGLNPYCSPLGLWEKKVGINDEPVEDNDAMFWGRKLEPFVADVFAEFNPQFKVQRINSIIQHPENEHHIASPDRILLPKKGYDIKSIPDYVKGTGMLEIKTVGNDMYWAHWANGIPEYVYAQLQWQLHCTGTGWGVIAWHHDRSDFKFRYFKKDEEKLALWIEKVNEFWHYVKSRKRPPIDGHPQTQEALGILHKQKTRKIVQLPDAASSYFSRYLFAIRQIEELTIKKEEASNALCNMVAEHEKGVYGGAYITWRTSKSGKRTPKIINPEKAVL